MNGAVVLFARTPEHGQVKTRLAEHYGDEAALRLHEAFFADTLEACRQSGARILLAHTNGDTFAQDQGVHASFQQQGDTFGERFDSALQQARRHHPQGPLVILGVDTPHLSPACLRAIFHALTMHDVVVGPAPRGGFYALGFRDQLVTVAEVFHHEDEIPTIQRLVAHNGMTMSDLAPFYDLDTREDLERLHRDPQHSPEEGGWTPTRTMALLSRLGLEKPTPGSRVMPPP